MGFFSVPRLSGWSFQHPSLRAGGSTFRGGVPSRTESSRRPPVTSKKVHCLFGDGENRQVFQRSQSQLPNK
ncbi:MAG: hypothetical protein ACQEQO_02600 [Thermodesulfobacteriota bacterium]